MRMNEESFETLYQYAKRVYSNEITLEDASIKVHSKHPEVAESSARHYLTWYSKMHSGDFLTWNTNSELLKYYCKKIIEEEGIGAGAIAIKSAMKFAKHVSRDVLIDDLVRLASENNIELSQSLEQVDLSDIPLYNTEDEQEMTTKEQIELIKSFIEYKGFTYDSKLIENFYLSLKSKPFVILAGTSGTGKTRLVRLFAEAISAKYKLVSVRPDWSDSSDLFGHIDLNGKYNPGEILKFMADAQKAENADIPYILCLDEMNLARVEYYLSDFLSIIETRDVKDGIITSDPLINEEKYGADTSALKEYGILRFPANFYLVGTVNMDETTFPFSKKVLDRANTIEFNYVDLSYVYNDVDEVQPLIIQNDFLRTEYLYLSQCEDVDYIEKISDELQKINEILKESNAHIGYRVRNEIIFYMLNNKNSQLLSDDEALDNEIMQKILPRIQGSSLSVKDMLCKLFVHLAGDFDSNPQNNDVSVKMENKLDADGSKFPKSAEKIAFMVRRFEEDGFTSYWL